MIYFAMVQVCAGDRRFAQKFCCANPGSDVCVVLEVCAASQICAKLHLLLIVF